MKDREFLQWLHARLVNVHHESWSAEYMLKLRAVVAAVPASQDTPLAGGGNFTLASSPVTMEQKFQGQTIRRLVMHRGVEVPHSAQIFNGGAGHASGVPV